MAVITWNNVAGQNTDAGSSAMRTAGDLFNKAITQGTKVGTDIAAQRTAEVDNRTKDALAQIKGIKDFDTLNQAQGQYGTIPGVAQQFGVVNERDILNELANRKGGIQSELTAQQTFDDAQRLREEEATIRGFDSGISPESAKSFEDYTGQVASLKEQIYAIPNLSKSQRNELFNERKAALGLDNKTAIRLSVGKYTVTDPNTGQQTIDSSAMIEELQNLGVPADEIKAEITAMKSLTGQDALETAAKEQYEHNRDIARNEYGIPNTNALVKAFADADADYGRRASEAVSEARVDGVPEHIINQALRTAREEAWFSSDKEFDSGKFEEEYKKLLKSNWTPPGLSADLFKPNTTSSAEQKLKEGKNTLNNGRNTSDTDKNIPNSAEKDLDRRIEKLRTKVAAAASGDFDYTPEDVNNATELRKLENLKEQNIAGRKAKLSANTETAEKTMKEEQKRLIAERLKARDAN